MNSRVIISKKVHLFTFFIIYHYFYKIRPYLCSMIITWGGDIITVRIIGSNSSNGMKLLKMVRRAVDDTNKNIKIEEVNDNNSYGIKNLPGLVIDGKIVSQGKVLPVREIYKLLNS